MPEYTPVFIAKIKNGKLFLSNSQKFNQWLSHLEGKQVRVIVKPYEKDRTIKQNRLYGFYLDFISNHTGIDPDDLHNTFRAMFLTDRSGTIPIIKSTTKLNEKEFSEYIEKIARKMAELDILLPEPKNIELDE